jgi:predicted NAD/FAD-binding protein
VIASHSDQPLAMQSDADDRERAILGAIGDATNTIYLLASRHQISFDGSVFPSFASAFSGKIMPRHSQSGEAISARPGRT